MSNHWPYLKKDKNIEFNRISSKLHKSYEKHFTRLLDNWKIQTYKCPEWNYSLN